MMRNLLLLSSLLLMFLSGCKEENTSIIGTWQLYKDGKPLAMKEGNHIMHRYKIINDETFVVIQTVHNDSVFNGYFIGDYVIEGNIYTENIKSTNPSFNSMVRKPMSFEIDVNQSTMHIKGINNDYNETWMRVSFSDLN